MYLVDCFNITKEEGGRRRKREKCAFMRADAICCLCENAMQYKYILDIDYGPFSWCLSLHICVAYLSSQLRKEKFKQIKLQGWNFPKS